MLVDLRTEQGKERPGETEKVALTCIHCLCKINNQQEAAAQHGEPTDDREAWNGEGGRQEGIYV